MDPEKKKKLEDAGWTVSSAGEFVGLSELDDAIILEQEAKTYIISILCPNCHAGQMKIDNSKPMLLCDPPLFPHVCNNCDHTENYRNTYPTTICKT